MMKAWITVALMAWAVSAPAHADDSVDLATELANPLAKLISIPVQGNYNSGYGPRENGEQVLTNLQPVIPFSINEDWNLISRTILPIVWQSDMFPGAGSQFGLGNTTQSFFFSPAKTVNGITWGVGPVLYVPTATDELLGPDTFGLGFMYQTSVGEDLLTGPGFEASVGGVLGEATWRGLTIKAGYTSNGSDDDWQAPYGAWPGYTHMILDDFNRAGEQALLVGGSVALSDSGLFALEGLRLSAEAAIDLAVDEGLDERNEYDFIADYSFAALTSQDVLTPLR